MRFFFFLTLAMLATVTAHAQRTHEFATSAAPGDAIVVAVESVNDLSALGSVIGADRLAGVTRAIAASGFEAKPGKTASFLTGDEAFGEIHLVGVGSEEKRPRDWEDFGGKALAVAGSSKAARIALVTPNGANVQAVTLGAAFGGYSFDRYKSDAKLAKHAIVTLTTDPASAARVYAARGRHLAEAVAWVRDMQSEPANVLYPEEFVRRARARFEGVSNVSVKVLDVPAMERLKMGAILGVGRGSIRPPRMLIVEYKGAGANSRPLVLVGKGITFDTGGISIKPNAGMWEMKGDMTGAAAVVGAVMSLAKSGAAVNAVAIAALAENMPDGAAQRPGDVVRAMSGKTIEILSTDAEGRLVLADAVWYAQENYSPSLLVDVATLTGAVSGALGDDYAGLFTRDDAIAERLLAAGEATGEEVWRLPLNADHNKQIVSKIADIKNSDTGAPGASTGAAFIGAFVKADTPWAHLDIAGVDLLTEARPTVPVGASAYSVRLLDYLAREMVNPSGQ